MAIEGGCLCGGIRYELSTDPCAYVQASTRGDLSATMAAPTCHPHKSETAPSISGCASSKKITPIRPPTAAIQASTASHRG